MSMIAAYHHETPRSTGFFATVQRNPACGYALFDVSRLTVDAEPTR
jgi:hypothetical protein